VAVAIMTHPRLQQRIVLTAARVPYAMARDACCPLAGDRAPALPHADSVARRTSGRGDRLDPDFNRPVVEEHVQYLFTYVVLAEFVFYGMSCGAVIVLRRKEPAMVRPYKAWGYPVTPIVFILFAVWLLYNTARNSRWTWR